jgi:DNA-binding PadR family transcriptional regulator
MKSRYAGSLSPEYALLGLLAQGPAHGYELHQKLAADLGQIWHLSQSQIYNILNRLEGKGFIHGTLQEQDKLPAKRSFSLTESGRLRFKDWIDSPSRSSVRTIRVEFTTRLYFALSINQEFAHQLIDAQTAETKDGLERLKTVQAQLLPDQTFNWLGLDLRIRQLSSILEWLDSCHEVISASQREESKG